MKEEIWKAIPDYQGYEISSFGNVRTRNKITVSAMGKRCWKDRTLKLKTDRDGYKRISLWSSGTQKDWLIHRLVAKAFLESQPGKDIINHIDGNPSNNHVDNLEWTDYQGNLLHAYEHGLNKEPNKVILFNVEREEFHYFRSFSTASLFLKRNKGYLSSVLKRGKNTIDGYEIYTLV
jgi:hypothetical protein